VAARFADSESGVTETPAERTEMSLGDTELTWEVYRCQDDHFVDLTGFYHTCHYLRSWAYTEVVCPGEQGASFVLTTNGPADMWINDQHVHRQEHFSQQVPLSESFDAALAEGVNRILVRFEAVAVRACPNVMALRVIGLPVVPGSLAGLQKGQWEGRTPFLPADEIDEITPEGAYVRLPTRSPYAVRQQMLEDIFAHTQVDEYVYYKGTEVMLRWDRNLDEKCHYVGQIQDSMQRIYAEVQEEAEPRARMNIGHMIRLWEGAYDAVVRPSFMEWFEQDTRYERRFPIYVLDHEYSDELYGTYRERYLEALAHGAKHERNVYTQIARMALGQWDAVNVEAVLESIGRINARADCSDFDLVGLLGVMYRYAEDPAFPEALKEPLEACVLNFKYWHDEPGTDAMCYDTENHSILFHTCEILAGQLYPDRVFANNGQTGQWHWEKGDRLALEWLRQRGTTGFTEWDSNCYFEEDLIALSHLFDLAETEDVCELAAVVIDKILYTIALNSFKGTFGSTHGRSYAPMIRSGQLEATSGISRLMWGMGVWNQHIRGIVSLACSEYEPTPVFAEVAADPSPEMWSRENHAGVNKVTYRTPDYMLCSVQDYHPGEPGYQQHVWQATMGSDAVVFVNHPASMTEQGSRRPNLWSGNVSLPRVAQWKDALLAIYDLPEDDWMGFTHAYFPVGTFDEHRMRTAGWAFARKGRAFLAITAIQGIELVQHGPTQRHELRSYGKENIWICFMGRPETDATFEDFQEKVLGLKIEVDGLSVRCETPHGDTLSFGWTEPFLVNGKEQLLSGFKHYESPFCTAEMPAEEMELVVKDKYVMRLDFRTQDA